MTNPTSAATPPEIDPTDLLPPGTPVDLYNCAREPIHLPGSVQPHGALLVARSEDGTITQVSANVADHLGVPVDAMLGRTLDDVLGADAAAQLSPSTAVSSEGASVRPMRVEIDGRAFDAHGFRPDDRLVAVELEPGVGEPGSDLSAIARVGAFSAGLRRASSIAELVGYAATALRDLTGFDRVWAYRFQPDGHGVVVAEDRIPELESFLGLHFPEGDIPAQARALYVRNGVRVIPDVDATPARLEPLENPETGAWLDLSDGSLRAVSPMHITYLKNLGVKASMSVSLVVDGQLWGLLSAHHYAGPRRVDLVTRGECELLGMLTSLQISAATELERTRHGLELRESVTRVMEVMATTESVADGLVADEAALLDVCRAAGAIVAIGADRRLVGETPAAEGIDALLEVLAVAEGDLIVSDALGVDHPELAARGVEVAGVIALPLSRSQGNWIVWCRPEHVHEVTWANRDKALLRRGPTGELDLGERESFERWAEQVRGRARPWHLAEVEAVERLRSSLGGLLLTRTDKLARVNSELERSIDELDAFAYAAAHDLREPVRGIEQFAGFFLEDHGDRLDDDGREQLDTIRRLNGRMDNLLTALLEYAQIGQDGPKRVPVDLLTVVGEVRELLSASAGPEVVITTEAATVEADPVGLRQLLFNLIWNGIKYTADDVTPRIEVGTVSLAEAEGDTPRVPRSIASDVEPTVVFVRDNGIGIDPEFHEQIFALFRRLHGRNEYGGGSGAGLTLGRRIVERHGGTMWVRSQLGAGSTFFFTLGPA